MDSGIEFGEGRWEREYIWNADVWEVGAFLVQIFWFWDDEGTLNGVVGRRIEMLGWLMQFGVLRISIFIFRDLGGCG